MATNTQKRVHASHNVVPSLVLVPLTYCNFLFGVVLSLDSTWSEDRTGVSMPIVTDVAKQLWRLNDEKYVE